MFDIQFIIFVENQEKSKLFYTSLLDLKPSLDVNGMTEFQLNKRTKLGIIPEKGIGKLLSNLPNPSLANGIPKCEIYLHVDNVLKCFEKAISLGAKSVNLPKNRDWGDFVGYVSDFDGNIIAFASKK